MAARTARFWSLLFAALALAPALAHLLELPNKIGLSRDDYLACCWSTAIDSYPRDNGSKAAHDFGPDRASFCVHCRNPDHFWTFTFPANQQTSTWTVLPEYSMALRTQWEYSHAASAVLNLIALIALIFSVLTTDK